MTLEQKTIKDIADDINQNRYILPSFQRPFVWSESQISALFDSIMRDYPIGVPLIWQTSGANVSNRYRFFEFLKYYICKGTDANSIGVQHTMSNSVYFVVLDGQQRLTALYLGINGYLQHNGSSSDKCYLYLNLDRLSSSNGYEVESNDEDLDDKESAEKEDVNAAIVATSLNEEYIFRFIPQKGNQPQEIITHKGEKWFLVSKVQDFNELTYINQCTKRENLSDSQNEAIVRLWERICCDTILSIQIDYSGDFDEAVLKFIRANMCGKPISKPEILRTMATASDVFKRDEFKDLRKEIIDKYGFLKNSNLIKASDFFIKVILSLLSHSVGSKIENFDNDFLDLLRSNYPKIRKNIVATFDLLKVMKISIEMLLSYNVLIPIIFYNFYRPKGPVTGKDTAEISKMKAWLLLSMITGAFGGQSDDTIMITREVFFKKGWAQSDSIEARVDKNKLSAFPCVELAEVLKLPIPNHDYLSNLVKEAQYNEKRTKLILLALYPKYRGEKINIDHIFPLAMMTAYSAQLVNSVLNLQPLDSSLNKSKNKGNPVVWFKKESEFNPDIYDNQLIPKTINNNFNDFLTEREKILVPKLLAIFNPLVNVVSAQPIGNTIAPTPKSAQSGSSVVTVSNNSSTLSQNQIIPATPGGNITSSARKNTVRRSETYTIAVGGTSSSGIIRNHVIEVVVAELIKFNSGITAQELIDIFGNSVIKQPGDKMPKNIREVPLPNGEVVILNLNIWNKGDVESKIVAPLKDKLPKFKFDIRIV